MLSVTIRQSRRSAGQPTPAAIITGVPDEVSPAQALSQRIRELRRKHFGPRGKDAFAERLGLPPEAYERYERGEVPPGDVLVRMCEATGEDLQWLLTGVAARGTVVISGARTRHSDLLGRIATLLAEQPRLASALEAFVALLAHRPERALPTVAPAPASQAASACLPIYTLDTLPPALESVPGVVRHPLPYDPPPGTAPALVELYEPTGDYSAALPTASAEVVSSAVENGGPVALVHSADLAARYPGAFGVRIVDDSMAPMFCPGDVAVVAPGHPPRPGRPAICRWRDHVPACCRIWLDDAAGLVRLGSLQPHELEAYRQDHLSWALEALYRLAPAA